MTVRGSIIIILFLASLGTSFLAPRPKLVWNASPSTTMGLYRVRATGLLMKGKIVVAILPKSVLALAAERRYLPHGVLLVKPVAGAAGDRVCALGPRIFINGRLAARRLARDTTGRALPWWSGCRTLGPAEIFLLSAGVPHAFDGRYFGISNRSEIIGEAILLWPERSRILGR